MSDKSNRRSYVRYDDEALVQLRKLDEASVRRIVAALSRWRLDYRPSDHLLPIRQHMRSTFRKIQATEPDIAAYLSHLERRIEKLSSSVQDAQNEIVAQPKPVNLSAQGIRCESPEPLRENDMLEVGLVLLPDHVEVAAIGRVVRVNAGEDDAPDTVSINFDYIRDQDQDALIRHVNQLQREMLSLRRKAA